MFPEDFYQEDAEGISFSRDQASRFAKQVADDFNPIHDPGAKLFCVPGDLLFALVLSRYGLSTRMRFVFSGMVTDNTPLRFLQRSPGDLTLEDNSGKQYLRVEWSGDQTRDPRRVESLTRTYVAFSGHNCPHILVPLMAQHRVMINPARPLVIYSGMDIELDSHELPVRQLQLADSRMEVSGIRGKVSLLFDLLAGEARVGQGIKYMEMRGLRPFDQAVADQMVADYGQLKQAKR